GIHGPERLLGGGKPLRQVLPHPDSLGALPRTQPDRLSALHRYHFTTMLAHVNPAPNATNRTVIPSLSRPVRTASSSAIAIEAAEVFPNRSTFTKTLSIGTPACFAVASMIRMLAWGRSGTSIAPAEGPALAS